MSSTPISSPVNARIDNCKLASIAQALTISGVHLVSKGALVQHAVDIAYEQLLHAGLAALTETPEEAAAIFRNLGLEGRVHMSKLPRSLTERLNRTVREEDEHEHKHEESQNG